MNFSSAKTDRESTEASFVIVGNCIAAMVAACELGNRGLNVTVVNPAPNWGGHFSSKNINGHFFDLGMVGFEFTGFHKKPSRDVLLYDSRRRNDVARFCALAQEYVEEIIPVHRAKPPAMLWQEHVLPDVLMGNDLEVLRMMPADTQAAIISEVEAILSNPDRSRHASKKVDNPLYLSMSYEEASIANHGATFHKLFIEPFANKLFAGGAGRFSANYHRCLWMPLYYPETLLAAMGAQPHDITTLFHYPAAGRIGALAEALLQRLEQLPNVRILTSAITSIEGSGPFTLVLADGSTLETSQLAWGQDLANLLRLTRSGEPRLQQHKFEKTAATFGFFAVDRRRLKRPFSSLFVIDPKYFVYRISNLSDAGGTSEDVARLVMECSSHFFGDVPPKNARMVQQISQELVQFGLIEDESAILAEEAYTVPAIMPVPNRLDHELFWESHDLVRQLQPRLKLIGPASGYLITTLNDQVIQGIKVAREVLI